MREAKRKEEREEKKSPPVPIKGQTKGNAVKIFLDLEMERRVLERSFTTFLIFEIGSNLVW